MHKQPSDSEEGESRLPAESEGGDRRLSSGNEAGDRRRQLLRYAGLSSEVVASVGLAVYLGMKADKWLKLSFPIFSWALPLLVIVVLLVQLVKAGSGKKNGK